MAHRGVAHGRGEPAVSCAPCACAPTALAGCRAAADAWYMVYRPRRRRVDGARARVRVRYSSVCTCHAHLVFFAKSGGAPLSQLFRRAQKNAALPPPPLRRPCALSRHARAARARTRARRCAPRWRPRCARRLAAASPSTHGARAQSRTARAAPAATPAALAAAAAQRRQAAAAAARGAARQRRQRRVSAAAQQQRAASLCCAGGGAAACALAPPARARASVCSMAARAGWGAARSEKGANKVSGKTATGNQRFLRCRGKS
jgi:hypothetical protein